MSRPFDYVAIGGHEETIEEIARSLHPYLSRLPKATFIANPNGMRIATLSAGMVAHDIEISRHRQEALAGRICDTAWGGGNGVLGLSATLEAANAQAIDTLAVAGPFTRTGAMCGQCAHLTRNGDSCPVCGAAMFTVDDVVAALMDATVVAGGKACQIDVAYPLMSKGLGPSLASRSRSRHTTRFAPNVNRSHRARRRRLTQTRPVQTVRAMG